LLKDFFTKIQLQKQALYLIAYLAFLVITLTPITLLAQPEVSFPVPVVSEQIVLVPSNFPPYSYLDKQNRAQGFAIDVFTIIAERAGISFKFKHESDRSMIVRALSQGDGDMVLDIGDQKDVIPWLDFTSSVVKIPLSIFVRQGSSSLNSINDLEKHKVAVVGRENFSWQLSESDWPANLNIEEFDLLEVAFYALITGKVDALIYLEPVVWNIAINLQLSDKIRVLPPPVKELSFSIGVRKQQQDLIQNLELARQSLMSSEQYRAIFDKWFEHDLPFWNMKSVFWAMSAIIVLTLLATQWFRSRELEAVNESLQQQIDDATLQLSESNAYLMDLTVTDTLTGINNRRAFENGLSELILRSKRYDEVFSMLIIDIDDFKKLNDQYGHDMGDRVLVELVDRVTEVVRDVDTLCRWGGEEFTILMPQTNQHGAIKMAERCRCAIADEAFDEVGPVTISLGVTSYLPNDNERKLFKRADDALYEAKSQGKNCVVWNDKISA
jgi:polar amino acid transport system substrate-binding protein